MTLVCKSVGIWDGIVNPIYGCGVKMAPDIIYAGLKRSCPRDSKNVSYVCWCRFCIDLFRLDWKQCVGGGWWGGGLSKNLVKPWA